ncbi:MAG: RNA pseudouridine synthase [Mycoplasmataceae bacterium]|jgi:23S rRNA pseudouridine1911/1915/1917 synthase|nr:RNA pseudouridine synthase [Mycoplasmataceae bacterium]
MNKNNYTGFEIIDETNNYFVINKFKNILVHSDGKDTSINIVDQLRDKINVSEFDDQIRPGVFQRLDKQTSGLMLIAKNKKTYDYFQNATLNKTLVKSYLAIVHNRINETRMLLKLPLERVKDISKFKVSSTHNAKMSITEVIVLENYQYSALVECILHTGRTHQVRVHLSYIKHPIFNDLLYGKDDNYGKDYGQFLFSHKIIFTDIEDNKVKEYKIQPDATFTALLEKLRNCKIIKVD